MDWLKDEQVLTPQGHAHNLIIAEAQLSDSGNYTCLASNVAARRRSSTAAVVVYGMPPPLLTGCLAESDRSLCSAPKVNGGWSQWAAWSACSAACGHGVQKRSRTCTSPAPLNGGTTCEGTSLQKVSCGAPCPAATGWSGWSVCSRNCERRRECGLPAGSRRGGECDGSGEEAEPCTGGLCRQGNGAA